VKINKWISVCAVRDHAVNRGAASCCLLTNELTELNESTNDVISRLGGVNSVVRF
jgi:hypothetical protein